MEQIDETNDRNLIAAYLYGFLDLWCLIGRHFLILIVCGFLSLMLCIIQPTLLVGESSKMARIFLGGMLVNIWPLGTLSAKPLSTLSSKATSPWCSYSSF